MPKLTHSLMWSVWLAVLGLPNVVFAQISTSGPKDANDVEPKRLQAAIDCIKSLHQPMGEPQAGDWLATYREQGQTFSEYVAGQPTLPTSRRRVLYVQPLGSFTESQRKIISLTAQYMELFFGLTVKLEPDKPLPEIPEDAQRVHPKSGGKQVRSTYLLSHVLQPTLPPDAHALIAFTSSDLYPGPEMNFVFGQASLSERVGVWSLYRLVKPDDNEAEFKRCLLRTMKIATHETGHMFGIPHCKKYECNMNGSNSLSETDRRPADACPECMAKLCWASKYPPRVRYEKLAVFAQDQGLTTEAVSFARAAEALVSVYPK